MASVIIGTHGLANKPEKQLLSDWWETAIKEGLKKNCEVHDPDFQFIMVYLEGPTVQVSSTQRTWL